MEFKNIFLQTKTRAEINRVLKTLAAIATALFVYLSLHAPQGSHNGLDRVRSALQGVQGYEAKLRTQANELQKVLAKIRSLSSDDAGRKSSTTTDESAIGGGINIDSPFFLLGNNHLDKISLKSNYDLSIILDNQVKTLKHTPLGSPVAAGRITSDFGTRLSPFGRNYQMHSGIDIAADYGTAVLASADGTVIYAGPKSGYGNVVIIEHTSDLESVYAHLSAFNVRVGDKLSRGSKIGQVGSTGHSTGPHLHYEIRDNGRALDPQPFLDFAKYIAELDLQA
ncbi:M23 family metallopeptidase [bacterium]|nr:M23 family metallopeptidase [bacterium]